MSDTFSVKSPTDKREETSLIIIQIIGSDNQCLPRIMAPYGVLGHIEKKVRFRDKLFLSGI